MTTTPQMCCWPASRGARHHKHFSVSTIGSGMLGADGRLASGRVRGGPRSSAGKERKTKSISSAVGALPAAPAIHAFCAAMVSAVSAVAALARFRSGPYSWLKPGESAEGRGPELACVQASCVITKPPAGPSVCTVRSSSATGPRRHFASAAASALAIACQLRRNRYNLHRQKCWSRRAASQRLSKRARSRSPGQPRGSYTHVKRSGRLAALHQGTGHVHASPIEGSERGPGRRRHESASSTAFRRWSALRC